MRVERASFAGEELECGETCGLGNEQTKWRRGALSSRDVRQQKCVDAVAPEEREVSEGIGGDRELGHRNHADRDRRRSHWCCPSSEPVSSGLA
jgi:hypothetical protein